MTRSKAYHWAAFDLDGSFELHTTDTKDSPQHYGHLLGPYTTKAETKRALKQAFRNCIAALKSSLSEVTHDEWFKQ